MATTPTEDPGTDPRMKTSADVADSVRIFNGLNEAHEDLWTRTHQASDAVRAAARERETAELHARQARDFHGAVQAEYPHRSAPLVRQACLAGGTLALDGVACFFAAQVISDSQLQAMLWALLFLAILAAGEIGLDHYSERGRRPWLTLAFALGAFVGGLGVLRFLYLATVAAGGLLTALVGAALFTAATAGFLIIGYRTLRVAERLHCWRARQWSRQAQREAAAASRRVARLLRDRNRLVDAYVSRIRVDLMKRHSTGKLRRLEAALRDHLTGRDSS